MKVKLVGLILAIFILGGIYFLHSSFKALAPAFLPVKKLSKPPLSVSLSPVSTSFHEQYDISQSPHIAVYVKNIPGVRDLQFSPEGTLLASQTSEGTVVAITNGQIVPVLQNLQRPHGLAFYHNYLFVAEEQKLTRYIWDEKSLKVNDEKVLFALPKGGRHFTRSIVINDQGDLFVSIGSTCDTCLEKDPRNGSVIKSNVDGTNPQIFARGLRNAVFLALNPLSYEVWGTEMGRDFLGDDTPADEINIIKDGADYGWPYCYNDKVRDTAFQQTPLRPDTSGLGWGQAANSKQQTVECSQTQTPIFQIPAHSAPLGLIFITSPLFPADWQGDLLVAYHGSWNRSVPDGYKVVHLKVKGNAIIGSQDFITGFIQGSQTIGRPVDLTFDKKGDLYLSDDKADVIYKLTLSH